MVIATENTASIRKCAFCKYWYDPTNSAIDKKLQPGKWEFQAGIRKICTFKNTYMKSHQDCAHYECKI